MAGVVDGTKVAAAPVVEPPEAPPLALAPVLPAAPVWRPAPPPVDPEEVVPRMVEV